MKTERIKQIKRDMEIRAKNHTAAADILAKEYMRHKDDVYERFKKIAKDDSNAIDDMASILEDSLFATTIFVTSYIGLFLRSSASTFSDVLEILEEESKGGL